MQMEEKLRFMRWFRAAGVAPTEQYVDSRPLIIKVISASSPPASD